MKNAEFYVIPDPHRFYARTNDTIIPVAPISQDSKVRVLEEISSSSSAVVDLSGFGEGRLGKYDKNLDLFFVFPPDTDHSIVEKSRFRWGHHLLPFASTAQKCIANSFGNSLISRN